MAKRKQQSKAISAPSDRPPEPPPRQRMIELVLVVLPLLLLAFLYGVADAHGPFHLAPNVDPDYMYLMNSAKVAEFRMPWSVQHPGIPVLIMGAAVVRAGQILNGLAGEWEAAIYPVLRHHNEYLAAIAWTQILLFVGLCFLAGRRIYRLTGSIWPALGLQAAPFLSWIALRYAYRVSPELMQINVGLALLWLLAPMTLGPEVEQRGRDKWRAAFAGVLLAVGIATKYHFVVAGALILLFPGLRQKVRVAGGCLGGLVILLVPVYARTREFRNFIGGKLSLVGGGGGSSWEGYLQDIMEAIRQDPVVTWSVALYVAMGAVLWFSGRRGEGARVNQLARVMGVGAIMLVGHLGLMTLRVRWHYYITAFALVYFMAPHVVEALRLRRIHWLLRVGFALGLLAIVLPAYRATARKLPDYRRSLAGDRQDSLDILAKLKETPECEAISYYPSSLPAFGLSFGNDLSGGYYGRQLEELYPGTISYNSYQVDFVSWEFDRLWRDVEERVAGGGCVLMSGQARFINDVAGFQTEPFYSPREGAPGDAVFRLSLDAGNPALLTGNRTVFRSRILQAEEPRETNAVTQQVGRIGALTSDAGPSFAEYEFTPKDDRRHDIRIRYASAEPRPMRLILNGEPVLETVCHLPTGGNEARHMKWHVLGPFPFRDGVNRIRLESDGPLPKIDRIALRLLPF